MDLWDFIARNCQLTAGGITVYGDMVEVCRGTIIKASGVGAASAAMLPVVQDELCMHRSPPTQLAIPTSRRAHLDVNGETRWSND
jgi:hypothetical protein